MNGGGVWFYHFLRDWRQHVHDSSIDSAVISGVPQGTVLGPLGFFYSILQIYTQRTIDYPHFNQNQSFENIPLQNILSPMNSSEISHLPPIWIPTAWLFSPSQFIYKYNVHMITFEIKWYTPSNNISSLRNIKSVFAKSITVHCYLFVHRHNITYTHILK